MITRIPNLKFDWYTIQVDEFLFKINSWNKTKNDNQPTKAFSLFYCKKGHE